MVKVATQTPVAASTLNAASTLESPYAEAWQAIRAAHQILVEKIGHDLAEAGLPELTWHDVLAKLDDSAGPLRPKDLLCQVGVTKSGLTRLLDRIETAGLVERSHCPSDRRGTFISITEQGRQTLADMRPIRDRVFEQHLAGTLSPAEAESIAEMLGRIANGVRTELEGDGGCDV